MSVSPEEAAVFKGKEPVAAVVDGWLNDCQGPVGVDLAGWKNALQGISPKGNEQGLSTEMGSRGEAVFDKKGAVG